MSDAVQEPEGGIDNTLASAFAQVRQQLAAAEGADEPTAQDATAPTRRPPRPRLADGRGSRPKPPRPKPAEAEAQAEAAEAEAAIEARRGRGCRRSRGSGRADAPTAEAVADVEAPPKRRPADARPSADTGRGALDRGGREAPAEAEAQADAPEAEAAVEAPVEAEARRGRGSARPIAERSGSTEPRKPPPRPRPRPRRPPRHRAEAEAEAAEAERRRGRRRAPSQEVLTLARHPIDGPSITGGPFRFLSANPGVALLAPRHPSWSDSDSIHGRPGPLATAVARESVVLAWLKAPPPR